MPTYSPRIKAVIQQLQSYFPAAVAGESADARLVDQVFQAFPGAPEELRVFWSECDGIRVPIDDEVVGTIYSVSHLMKMLSWWLDDSTGFHSTVLPIADDGCGDFHCLHCGESGLNGCVVFVDQHWTPAYLLAGSLPSYLEFWAESCMAKFTPDGKKDPRYVPPRTSEWPFLGESELSHPWPYDEKWLRTRDSDAERILQDSRLRNYFTAHSDS